VADSPSTTLGGRTLRVARTLFQRFSRSAQQKQIDHLTRLVERVLANQKQDEKWRMIFRRQMNAVIRNFYIAGSDIPGPQGLSGRRFRLRSQNEEDGIILALLQGAGVTRRRFVEIGCGLSGGNSAVLAFEFGWSGLMVDARRKAIAGLRVALQANPGAICVRATVTPDTINDLLERHGMVGDLDLLSIDIDSVDYWLLEALTVCSPRVIVMEYNALFGPDIAVTVPNAPTPGDAPKGYSGASIAALEQLARRKGYRLVLCEEAGVNAFFLRDDVAPEVPSLTSAQAYRPWLDKRDARDARRRDIDIYQLVEDRGLPLVHV